MSNKLTCYFPGEKTVFMEIEINLKDRVISLIREIAAVLHSDGLTDVRPGDLLLYKTDLFLEPDEDLQLRALQWLRMQPPNSQLQQSKRISLVFPDGPYPSEDDKLDIIVASQEVLEMLEKLGDSYNEYCRKVKNALDKRLNNLSPLLSPSEIVDSPKTLETVFGGNNPRIHLGRLGGAPAVIFNPVLAKFKQRLEHLEQVQVSPRDVAFAAQYLCTAVKFYPEEKYRETAISSLVNTMIGETTKWRSTIDCATGRIIPNACWWHDLFLILVLELKNTLGLRGDPLYQAIIDYSKVVSENKYKRFREYCNFPIVLVGIMENRLEIAVAVCVGSIYVTKLLTLDLCLGFHSSDNMIHLARVFAALSQCRTDLNNYYREVSNSTSPRLSCLFPNVTLLDPTKSLPKLTYKYFLSRAGQPTSDLVDLKDTTTAMYTASLDDIYQEANQEANVEVIVKFTTRYNEAAHRLLAEARLAPRLHFCGRVVGDLYMIVMDRVDGMSVWQLQGNKTPIPAVVATKVEEAVHLLHNKDIVFGDLRSNNILYVAHEDRVVLVDFDWAGENGQARYPATLNAGDRDAWPADVEPYGIMLKDHDLWQLQRLKDMCVKSNV